MKPSALLFFCLFISVTSIAQDCKKIDSVKIFSTLKFGEPVPAALLKTLGKAANGTWYRIVYENLDGESKKKYANLFKLSHLRFSYMEINTNRRGQVMDILLWSPIKDLGRVDTAAQQPPAYFTKLYDHLTVKYGKPTSVKEEVTVWDGITKTLAWHCNEYDMTMEITYRSKVKPNNLIIRIKNRRYEAADLRPVEGTFFP